MFKFYLGNFSGTDWQGAARDALNNWYNAAEGFNWTEVGTAAEADLVFYLQSNPCGPNALGCIGPWPATDSSIANAVYINRDYDVPLSGKRAELMHELGHAWGLCHDWYSVDCDQIPGTPVHDDASIMDTSVPLTLSYWDAVAASIIFPAPAPGAFTVVSTSPETFRWNNVRRAKWYNVWHQHDTWVSVDGGPYMERVVVTDYLGTFFAPSDTTFPGGPYTWSGHYTGDGSCYSNYYVTAQFNNDRTSHESPHIQILDCGSF